MYLHQILLFILIFIQQNSNSYVYKWSNKVLLQYEVKFTKQMIRIRLYLCRYIFLLTPIMTP